MVTCRCCCCCWLSGGDRFLSHHDLRPSVGPVLNPYPHNGVCVCVCIGTRPRCPHMHMHMRVLWAVFVQFILVRRPHYASHPQHWPSCLNRPIQAGESVDQWSRVPTGTVVEQIAPIATVMNATSIHSLQRTTPNRLSCPGLTPCVSSHPGHLCQPTYVGEAYDSGQRTSLTQCGVPWITAPSVVLPYTGCQPNISRAILPRRKQADHWRKTLPTDTPILAQPARSQATK